MTAARFRERELDGPVDLCRGRGHLNPEAVRLLVEAANLGGQHLSAQDHVARW